MARDRTTRQPAGPRQASRRPRTARIASPTSPSPAPRTARTPSQAADVPAAAPWTRRVRDVGFTRRALVLLGVVAILALSYANSLRIMLNQQRDLATANAQIQARQAQLTDLDAQLQRWRDPAYVKSQARAQLGWVMPGETGYRVIGLDGTVMDDPGTTHVIAGADGGAGLRWWDRLATSIAAADLP